MGESWMGLWVFTLIGVFIIAVTIYDYFDRKKRAQEIKVFYRNCQECNDECAARKTAPSDWF